MFQDNLSVRSLRIKQSKKTFEGGTDRSLRNVANYQSTLRNILEERKSCSVVSRNEQILRMTENRVLRKMDLGGRK